MKFGPGSIVGAVPAVKAVIVLKALFLVVVRTLPAVVFAYTG